MNALTQNNIDFISLYDLKFEPNSNDKIIDFLSTFVEIDKSDINILDAVYVDYSLVCRLDKLCIKYYPNINCLDRLLEYNGIVNPFDVPLGTVLFIPTIDALNNKVKSVVVQKFIRKMNQIAPTISLIYSEQSNIGENLSVSPISSIKDKEQNARSILNSRNKTGIKVGTKSIRF